MKFCPQCGTSFDQGARFCPECGFDKSSVEMTAPSYNQTGKPVEPSPQRKEKKAWMRIVFIIIGLSFLGAAGWFGYNQYNNTTKGTSPDASANTKPMSLMDQELAMQKAKTQNQGTQQHTTHEAADEAVVVEKKELPSRVILEVGHSEESKNKNPKNPTKLTISKQTMITRITTDHYNDGMGTPRGGNIIIKDRYGITLGTYKAFGKKGINRTPSAKWVAEPNVMLDKGTYFISDSEIQTWSRTFLGSNGFVVVEGYEVE